MNCINCFNETVKEITELITFPYGSGVELGALVVVLHCSSCNFRWTDYRAENVIDERVRQYEEQRKQELITTTPTK